MEDRIRKLEQKVTALEDRNSKVEKQKQSELQEHKVEQTLTQQEIRGIKERNQRVEKDKAWETSWQRKFVIAISTYAVIVVFFWFAEITKPFTNAVVPTAAFVLSTWTAPMLKKWWLRRQD